MSTPIGRPLKEQIDDLSSLTFSLDSKTLASASNSGTITFWDVAEGRSSGQSHLENASNLTFSPDGKTLAYGNQDGAIILWDVVNGRQIGQPLIGNASTFTFGPDGKTAAFGTRDGNIIVWNVATGSPIGQPLFGNPTAFSFNPDGRRLAILIDGLLIYLMDVTTGHVDQYLEGHTQVINVIAFSPDGETLASGSNDATIILWDVASGKPKGQLLEGHTQAVTALAFSPDDKTMASGSCGKQSPDSCIEGEVLIWDLSSQQPIGTPFMGHAKKVTKLAFSPDGKSLASGSEDSTIILWDLDPRSWIEKSCQRANRNFTPSEWEHYFPARKTDYQKTCSQLPVPTTETLVPIATPIINTSPVSRPASYFVQAGETLPCIARRYNVNMKELFALNRFVEDWIYGELLYPNSVLKIPQTGNPFPGARALRNHPATYTVVSANETPSSIACQFGDVDPSTIAAANGLSFNTELMPGQLLNIP
jgi:WD40 repeat protein/LysM repeat protein